MPIMAVQCYHSTYEPLMYATKEIILD